MLTLGPMGPWARELWSGPRLKRSVSVVAVLLGGSTPGSVPATRRDSPEIRPPPACLVVDPSVAVAGHRPGPPAGLIRSLSKRRGPSQMCRSVIPSRPVPTLTRAQEKGQAVAHVGRAHRRRRRCRHPPRHPSVEIAYPTGAPIATIAISNDSTGYAELLAWISTTLPGRGWQCRLRALAATESDWPARSPPRAAGHRVRTAQPHSPPRTRQIRPDRRPLGRAHRSALRHRTLANPPR